MITFCNVPQARFKFVDVLKLIFSKGNDKE